MTTSQPAHRTVSLHEWHVIGPDGLPRLHRTIQVIKALRPGLEAHHFRFDRREATLHRVRGASPGEPYVDPQYPTLTTIDLRFPRPLEADETTSIEYETRFRWQSVPPPHFRRAARLRVENLDMRVIFDRDRLPAEVYWCVWDGFGEDAVLRAVERLELDSHHAVHRFVEKLEGYTVGFSWTWPPGQEPVVSH